MLCAAPVTNVNRPRVMGAVIVTGVFELTLVRFATSPMLEPGTPLFHGRDPQFAVTEKFAVEVIGAAAIAAPVVIAATPSIVARRKDLRFLIRWMAGFMVRWLGSSGDFGGCGTDLRSTVLGACKKVRTSAIFRAVQFANSIVQNAKNGLGGVGAESRRGGSRLVTGIGDRAGRRK